MKRFKPAYEPTRRDWLFLAAIIVLVVYELIVNSGDLWRPAHATTTAPTDAEWAHILGSSGFGDQTKLLLALEIMFAESGGDCSATNPSGARGCWQFKSDTLGDDSCARNPVCSTQAAYRISKGGTDWGKWEAFTSKNYRGQEQRARAAIAAATPGCNWVTDTPCFLNMISQPVPVTFSLPSIPSLDQASPIDILKLVPADKLADLVVLATANGLHKIDIALFRTFDGLWGPLIGGEDNLSGKQSWGPVVTIDNTIVEKSWKASLIIAEGSLALLLLTLAFIWRMASSLLRDADPKHDYGRDLIYLLVAMILAAGSSFLIQVFLDLSNAFTNTVGGNTALELRQLSVVQGLGFQKPDFLTAAQNQGDILLELIATIFSGIEMVLLFFLYFVRLIILGALKVMAPFAIMAAVFQPGRRFTIYWLEALVATVLIKPINALLFALYVQWGVSANSGFLNALLLLGFLFVMLIVPRHLWGAAGNPGPAVASAHAAGHSAVTYLPLRVAAGMAWNRVRGGGGR